MIDLEEMAAIEIRRHEGFEPALSTIAARAIRRRRKRYAVVAGTVGAFLISAGAIGTVVVGGPSRELLETTDTLSDSAAPTNASRPASTEVDPTRVQTVEVLEGSWVTEILARIAEQVPDVTVADLEDVLDSNRIEPAFRPAGIDSWEGLLFPTTYDVADGSGAVDVLSAMNREFTRQADELGYRDAEARLGISAYEAVIVASIVEAETTNDEDRAKVARVIYNRLEADLSLDIDSICIFGAGDRNVELTPELLTSNESGFACRQNPGLPPTPIASPSRASLLAAIEPAPNPVNEDGDEEKWLYYIVRDVEGRHFFTDDFEEFLEQKQLAVEQGLLAD